MGVEVETYLDCGWDWLKALTREKRAQRAQRPKPCVRFSLVEEREPPRVIRRRGASVAWRKRQWKLGNRHCGYCSVRLVVQGKFVPCWHPQLATVDHRQPLGHPTEPGDDDPHNWIMCCNACNNRKGVMTEAQFRALLVCEAA